MSAAKLKALKNTRSVISKQIDNIVLNGGVVNLADPLSVKFTAVTKQIKLLTKKAYK